jgi:hypothetical protein
MRHHATKQAEMFVCECGNPGVGFTSNREPICQRCRDMEKTMNLQIKANRKVGVSIQDPMRGKAMNWEERYALYADSSPIVGASLEILNRMLKAA